MLETDTNRLRSQITALLADYPDLQDDEFLRADMLEGSTDLHEVLTSIHRMIDDAKGLRDGTKARLDDLAARKDRFQRRVDFGRDLIAKIMDTADLRKVELPEVTLSIRKNPPRVLGDPDASLLPAELTRVTITPDKAKIREALEQGREVQGCILSNAPPSLTIRVK